MRYRLMATYQGAQFEAGIGPAGTDIVLFAACPPPEDLGFGPATGHWRKHLHISEVQAIWESRPVGTFRGERCLILDDMGERLHICYLGHDAHQAERLGFWQVDRGVFELVAPRTEVADITEERVAYPVPPTAQPASQARSGGTAWRYDAGWQAAGGMAVDAVSGVALPGTGPPPLPLEAEALRALQAQLPPAAQAAPASAAVQAAPLPAAAILADLVSQAGLPAGCYALGEEVDGVFCLLPGANGIQVFRSAHGARLGLQTFPTEEAACYYLFGLLAATALQAGSLVPAPAHADSAYPPDPARTGSARTAPARPATWPG